MTYLFNRIPMPQAGTPEWHELRRISGITASEMAAVLGLSKYGDALLIWLLKRGLTIPDAEDGGRIWLRWGNAVEPVLKEWYERETGYTGEKPDFMIQSKEYPYLCANLDWANFEIRRGADFKWVEHTDGWGDNGTQDVPLDAFVQVQQQLIVSGLEVIDLYARLPHNDFRRYPITPDAYTQDRIKSGGKAFWDSVTDPNGEPPKAKDLDSAKKQFPNTTDETVALDSDEAMTLVTRDKELCDLIKGFETEQTEVRARIVQLLGENRRATVNGWNGSITRSKSPDKEVPEQIIPAHIKPGRDTFRINHPRK